MQQQQQRQLLRWAYLSTGESNELRECLHQPDERESTRALVQDMWLRGARRALPAWWGGSTMSRTDVSICCAALVHSCALHGTSMWRRDRHVYATTVLVRTIFWGPRLEWTTVEMQGMQ